MPSLSRLSLAYRRARAVLLVDYKIESSEIKFA